jgi:hypothetical protein
MDDGQEYRILEAKVSDIADLEAHARVCAVSRGVGDVFGGEIHASDDTNVGIVCESKRQAPCPATGIEDTARNRYGREINQQWGQPSAPATHLRFVAIAIGCQERG